MNYNKQLFLEPEVKQYDSHMVMTNVTRPTKHKFINIDSKYRDDYTTKYLTAYDPNNTNTSANFNVTLPERITEVKSIMVTDAEIPMAFFNISGTLGNNWFKIISGSSITGGTSAVITIPNGNYATTSALVTAVNAAITANATYNGKITFAINSTTQIASFTSSNGTFTIEFDVDSTGNLDAYQFKNKFGWLVGFRKQYYTISSSPSVAMSSENICNLNTIRYLYLVIDEFSKGNQNSFISPMQESLIRKNIIAKITMNPTFAFGSFIPANNFNGLLLTDRRSYTGKIDLLKLNVQLVDDRGVPVDLNGLDFSFCLEVEHE